MLTFVNVALDSPKFLSNCNGIGEINSNES